MSKHEYSWGELAFGSKKPINQLQAMFIVAPRELSQKRFTQLIKMYLPKGNIVLGIAHEQYIAGLEDRPQFRTLRAGAVQNIIDRVNTSGNKHTITILRYNQRDITFILEKLDFKNVILVNGSWYRAFHMRPEFYTLVQRSTPFEKVSPFADEAEARAYPDAIEFPKIPTSGAFTEDEMLKLAGKAGQRSYDFGGFQIGVSLGHKKGQEYELLATAHNAVVPYETYAMHHGAARETHFSPVNDQNHYDTVHAEIALLVKAQKERIGLHGTTLFINLLPCPMCTRMLTQTDIESIVYSQDHSGGYGLKMLELAGKKVTRKVE